MTEITENLSNKIANMSFVGACLIVLHHVPLKKEVVGCYGILWELHSWVLIAVPLFFMVSGFLLAGHCYEHGWWLISIKKRLKTLLLPYLIVNAVYMPLMWLYHNIGGSAFRSEMAYEFNVFNFLAAFGLVLSRNPACGPLWYVRDLFFLVLLSPLLLAVLKRSRLWAYGATSLCFVGWYLLPTLLTCCSFCKFLTPLAGYEYGFRWVAFFCLGMTFRLYGIPRFSWRVSLGALAVSLALCFVRGREGIDVWHMQGMFELFPLVGLVAVWGIPALSRAWPSVLTRNAFAIFVVYELVQYGLKVLFKLLGCNDFSFTMGGYFCYWLVPVAVSIIFAEVLRRCMPKFAELTFGGR